MPSAFCKYKFASAAGRVHTVIMKCDSVTAAAQANNVLLRLAQVACLSISGSYLPTLYPLTLKRLSVTPAYTNKRASFWELAAAHPDVVILSWHRLPGVQRLDYTFVHGCAVRLTCPIQLGNLESLHLQFSLLDCKRMHINLSWLHQQPLHALTARVCIHPHTEALRILLLQQLAGIRFTELSLARFNLTPVIPQTLWEPLSVHTLVLEAWDHCYLSCIAEGLPHCHKLVVKIKSNQEGPVCFSWPNLTKQPMDIRLMLQCRMELHIQSFDALAHERLQQPWQLVVQGTDTGCVACLPPGLRAMLTCCRMLLPFRQAGPPSADCAWWVRACSLG